jgi:hypothetical protein
MALNRVENGEEFINEAKKDNYVEYSIDGEDAVLVYDVGEGFNPYMVSTGKYNSSDDEQELDDMLMDEDLFRFSGVTYSDTNSQKGSFIFHIDGAEI